MVQALNTRSIVFHTVLYQIKYLRVPDTLLDAVKEEQNRAREAGRSNRGSHAGGGGRGGGSIGISPDIMCMVLTYLLQDEDTARPKEVRILMNIYHATVLTHTTFSAGRGAARGGPIRGGRGRGRGM